MKRDMFGNHMPLILIIDIFNNSKLVMWFAFLKTLYTFFFYAADIGKIYLENHLLDPKTDR